jgi:tight junction protein 1
MNKNKHCLLDVTPHSVEKLQYAQYCPIVIYISVDSRSRLRDLRKKHSKTAASKNSRKLQEQALKIQKMYSYLFTGKEWFFDSFFRFDNNQFLFLAVLDASHEDHWFEALRELISHLQERRVWMAESRPVELLDDDFLFPMANSRSSGNYAGDSDLDSLRGVSIIYIFISLHILYHLFLGRLRAGERALRCARQRIDG